MNLPNKTGAIIVDTSIAVAIVSHEAGLYVKAIAELRQYAALGYQWFAPGAIVTETLYALCRKHEAGLIKTVEFDNAVIAFDALMQDIFPPPQEDGSLVNRIHAIGKSYSCRR